MQRIRLVLWAKATFTACLSAVAGCGEFEGGDPSPVEVELRGDPGPAKQAGEAGPHDIPGHYIVVMKRGANPKAAAAAAKAKPNHLFSHVISGFAGPLNAAQVESLSHRSDVVFIEPDQVVTAAKHECPNWIEAACPDYDIQYKNESLYWGVDRVDQRQLPFSNTYSWTCDGTGVPVYVFDTGVQTSHPEFGNRAAFGYDAFGGNGEDCNGHGTHVAGIIGGEHYGVAKQAQIRSVRVLDCNGKGSWSKLIAAMDWLARSDSKPAVANMSLSGSWSWSVNLAVANLVDSGVVVVVAAGNKDANACWYSPGSAASAMTIAAHYTTDTRASFSNYGSCVDMYAPGSSIRSAWLNGGNKVASGTSMASPHVAGAAAMYLQALAGQQVPLDQIAAKVAADIEGWANRDLILDNPSNTPNLQIHWPCSGAPEGP